MEYLNKVMLQGVIAFQPEFKDVGVHRFVRVSLLHVYKHAKTDQEFKNYINVEFWGSRATAFEGHKPKVGGFLFVDGSLKVNVWEKDGIKKTNSVVNAIVFNYRDIKKGDESLKMATTKHVPERHTTVEPLPHPGDEIEDDGLPF